MTRAGIPRRRDDRGFTLLELLIAMALGLIVIGGVLSVFLAFRQVSSTTKSQASIQNADNVISAILSPAIRGAGFGGCGTLGGALNTTNGAGALVNNYALAVQGYDASGTSGGGTVTIAADNAAGDSSAGDWSPSLDASFGTAGIAPESGSDVLVVSGAMPGAAPAGVSVIATGTNNFTVTDNALANVAATLTGEGLPAPAALSDCGKAVVFMVTAVANGGGNNLVVTHGAPANAQTTFTPAFPPGSQFVPLQQAAFYVGQGPGGMSALYKAVYVGGSWVATPIVPGVENMQVMYSVATNGTYQWVSASAVAAGPGFGTVSAVRVGFLMAGNLGSAHVAAGTPFDVLGTSVTAPADTRLRHVFVMTVDLRNAGL